MTAAAEAERDRLVARVAELEAALRACGRHLEDCCRTDLGLGEQLDSHDAAVTAFHRANLAEPAQTEDDHYAKWGHAANAAWNNAPLVEPAQAEEQA